LTLRVMESPRAAPAVGAAIDRLAAKSLVDATELTGQQVDRGLPAHRDERLRSAARARTRSAVEPAGPHHRLDGARRMSKASDDVAEERGRIGVVAVGMDRDDGAVRDLSLERSPVGGVGSELSRHLRGAPSVSPRGARGRRAVALYVRHPELPSARMGTMLPDASGLPVSTTSRAAVDAYDRGVRSLLGFGADTVDRFNEALGHDPEFAVARAALAVTLYLNEKIPEARRAMEAASAALPKLPERERRHIEALALSMSGRANDAIGLIQEILAAH